MGSDGDAGAAGQELLHEAAFLVVEGGALLAEEAEFGVGGVEDGGDGALFGDVAWNANFSPARTLRDRK
ncbi:MAG: hypothetical protein H7067_00455 [Burkholderiales bacterium]|nr:hypothetical protein [Opitutaceae bacterium]